MFYALSYCEIVPVNSIHELSNYKDIKTNCRHLKKLTWKGTLRQVFLEFIDWGYNQDFGISDPVL
jgi:hypothetical protein